jgi:hypothetical protein
VKVNDATYCTNCGGLVQPSADGKVTNPNTNETVEVEGNVGICSACGMAVDMNDPEGENWEPAPEDDTETPERVEDLGLEDKTPEQLVNAHNREELDALAAKVGVEDAEDLETKADVAEAILASREEDEDEGGDE